ncbi:Serine/threonine-protein kinase spk-1 [Colletotrichum tabaci]|uniref:Serine/threonine-protein kinase spk-1 n=1 Tax=Colletotrichum tabaci TaxID=1209068 RepID=A0AAV9TKG1_9PEZI
MALDPRAKVESEAPPDFSLQTSFGGDLKYFPYQLRGECEDLEAYEPGGFHPVHLGDTFDGRYKVVHKLGFGGFSTVWLARDSASDKWAALKIVVANESSTYETRSVVSDHSVVLESEFFDVATRKFWIDGPNGHHLCLMYPFLGPDLSRLSKGIYTRFKPESAKALMLQAAQALSVLHAEGLCHGDFTASNIALRLKDDFHSFNEEKFLQVFGRPRTDPVRPYSEESPEPHAPKYIVEALDFLSSSSNLLSERICIIDFDQSFTATSAPTKLGTPAKYLAPEVAVGEHASPASDVWALGCAIFRVRSGEDLFFDYDTNCPADVLRQIVKTVGDLPDRWKETQFDEDGNPTKDQGEPFWALEETRPLKDRVHEILDEPQGLFIDQNGEPQDPAVADPAPPQFESDGPPRVPYTEAYSGMLWKPTAVCVDGGYFVAYSDESDEMLKAFPKIAENETTQLIDLLSKIFEYDPAKRVAAKELIGHPWFGHSQRKRKRVD